MDTPPTYANEKQLTVAEFVDVLQRSTLRERRPIDDPALIKAMLRNADIIMTARCDGMHVDTPSADTWLTGGFDVLPVAK